MKLTYVAASLMALLLLTVIDGITYSGQPPTGRTGAPGEATCNSSGCHSDFSTVTNSGSLTMISLGGNVFQNGYTPGQTYNMAFTNNFSSAIYGFELTILDTNSTAGVTTGSFNITNPSSTALQNGGSRQYVSHNNASGSNAWAFQWTAPTGTTPDTVYVYAASNAANNSGDPNGDVIHTKTFIIPLAPPVVTNPCGDVFISEYVEGSGFNKSIEIYNPTSSPINLSGYRLQKYTNGATTPGTATPLSGVVQPYDVRVFTVRELSGGTPVDAALQAKTDSFMNTNSGTEPMYFNGDDALVLLNSANDTIDIFGKIGEDPGTGWSSGGVSTLNHTLVRKPWVNEGVTSNPSFFDPSAQWIQFGQDFFDSLQTHRSVCQPNFCSAFSATATITDTVSCFGSSDGAVTITVNNSSGFYKINGDLTGLSAGSYQYTVIDTAAACTTQVSFVMPGPSQLILTTGSSPEACSNALNGKAWATASGGTPGYTYTWSSGMGDTISGLSSGTYTVTVTDANGCTATTSVNVGQSPPPTVSLNKTDASCSGVNNGKVWATPVGGSAPFNYSWSVSGSTDTISGLAAGTYHVTVTDQFGCSATNSITIGVGSGPRVTVTKTDASCGGVNNGTATAAPFDGTGPYTVVWSAGGATTLTINSLAPGTYTVTVTDFAGCTVTGSTTVGQGTGPTVSLTKTNASCSTVSNGTATATPSGGTGPYSYLWSGTGSNDPSNTGLSQGLYTVTVTDANGCTVSDTISVGANPSPTVGVAAIDASCPNVNNGSATATPSGATMPYGYLWSNSATAATTNNLAPGTYTVTLTDGNGCSAVGSDSVGPGVALSITLMSSPESCNTAMDGQAWVVYNNGTAPYSPNWSNSSTTDTISGLDDGTYSVSVTDANGCQASGGTNVAQGNGTAAQPGPINIGDTLCTDGTQYPISVPNVTGVTYTWTVSSGGGLGGGSTNSTTYTPTVPGVYTISVTATNICGTSSASTATVEVFEEPEAGFTFVIDTGRVVHFTNTSTGDTSRLWDFGFGLVNAQNNPTVTFPQNMAFEVCLTVNGICGTDMICDTVDLTTVGLTTLDMTGLAVFPNPVLNELSIEWAGTANNVDLMLMNTLGEVVAQERVSGGSNSAKLNTANLASGMYLLHVNSGDLHAVYKIFRE